MKHIRHFAVGIAVVLAGCGSDPAGTGGGAVRLGVTREPATPTQNGAVMVPGPQAQLLDAAGNPVAQRGVLVSLSVAAGSGTLAGTTAIRTDDQGAAKFDSLVVTGAPGPLSIRFSAPGVAAAVSREIQLAPGTPTGLTVVTGSNQVAPAGTDVAVVPSVRVVDQSGNGVPGVAVAVTVEGGGSVGQSTLTTDATGLASVGRWTLGPRPGRNLLTWQLTGGPATTVEALGVVGPPAKLTKLEGDGQTAVAGQPVATPPAVRVTDAFDNPIEGVTVTFAVNAGGGLLTGAQPKSDTAGVARLGSWTLGPEAGANAIQASRTGIPTATFNASASAVPVTILAGDKQLGFAGAELRVPVQVKVANGFGVARAGVTVTFAATGGGSFTPATATTDSTGRAQAVWTVGTTPGVQSADLVAAGAATTRIEAEVVRFKQVVAGRLHACGLTTAGAAYCWGDNRLAQIGDSTFTDRNVATRVKTALVFDTLIAGANGHFTCGRVPTQEIHCWGSNNHGQSGDGTNTGGGGPFGNARPYPVAGAAGLRFKALTGGGDHACGLADTGVAYCWGRNNNAEIGNGGSTDVFDPTAVIGGLTFKSISAGEAHTCALDTAGAAYCWGNANFRLGLSPNPVVDVSSPAAVQGGGIYTQISAGTVSTCALKASGEAFCWGTNGGGQLGDGTTVGRSAPAAIAGGHTFAAISTMGGTGCGLKADGSLVCWGVNSGGEAGVGSTFNLPTPTAHAGPRRYSTVSIGASTSCALEIGTGAVYCWGPNTDGQVGDGTLAARTVPTLVRF